MAAPVVATKAGHPADTADRAYRLLIVELCDQRDKLELFMQRHGELMDEGIGDAAKHYAMVNRQLAELIAYFRNLGPAAHQQDQEHIL